MATQEETFRDKLVAILKGAGIAFLGAGLAAFLQFIEAVDWGQFGPFAAAIAAIIVNALRKYVLPLLTTLVLPAIAMIGLLAALPGRMDAAEHEPGDVLFILQGGGIAKLVAPPGSFSIVSTAPGAFHIYLGGGGPQPSPPAPPNPGPGPSPPAPGPGPAPSPEPPETALGVARFAYAQAIKIDPPARAKAPSVAKAFRGLYLAIASGSIGVLQIPNETRKAFDAAVGEHKSAWAKADQAMQEELKRLNRAGKVTTVQQLAEAYDEIAVGMDYVR